MKTTNSAYGNINRLITELQSYIDAHEKEDSIADTINVALTVSSS